jgi:hypothetical protein
VLATFLVDGFVAGTWSVASTKKQVRLTFSPFSRLPAAARAELAEEGTALLRFLAPRVEKSAVEFSKA